MLRSISMHNFIHFNEPQRLEFQDGANFLIGGNSTGKTAIFELLRRCFSNKINTTNSSFNEDGNLPYIVSHFKVPDTCKILPTKASDILACLFVEKCSGVDAHQTLYKYYKVLCVLNGRKKINIYINRYTGSYACNTDELGQPEHVQSKYNELNFINVIISNKRNEYQTSIKQLFDIIKQLKYKQDSCKYMQSIFDWLEQSYVGVMSMRSIGPLQWTRSSKNSHSNRENNYKMACDRAEILNALLESDQIDSETEQQFHKALVYPYRFKKDTSNNITTIWVCNDEDKTKKPLLKTPVGIVEAQELILILSHSNLLTITLEEPDRGMHPHMIMKMRDWVLKKVKDKTVLVISHQAEILDHETIQRSYLCHRTQKSGTTSHTVVKVPEGYNRYGRTEEIRQLLFSPRILFVEGLVDKIILEAVLNVLINHNVGSSEVGENLRNYLASIHVISIGGKDAGPKVKQFCDKIKRQSFVLYDLDVLFPINDKRKSLRKKSSRIRLCAKAIKKFEFDETFSNIDAFKNDSEATKRLSAACEKSEVFIWKCGTIEDVINEIVGRLDDEIKKRLVLPITDKARQRWKSKLVDRSCEDIEKLALTLIQHSDEFKRLRAFLQQMMQNENEIDTSRKRKRTVDYDRPSSSKVARCK